MKLMSFFAFAGLSVAVGSMACASNASLDEDAPADEAELSKAGQSLVGAYTEGGDGDIRALVLTTEAATRTRNRFFATVKTGIVCFRAPCPTEARVAGTWYATKTQLVLTPDSCPNGDCSAKPHAERRVAERLAGKYKYDLVKTGDDDAKLHLEPKSSQDIDIPGSLEKVRSYCTDGGDARDECSEQGLPVPRCAPRPGGPGWTCKQNQCVFSCSGGSNAGSCANKGCGASCSLCNGRPGCVETAVPKYCGGDGVCRSGSPVCL